MIRQFHSQEQKLFDAIQAQDIDKLRAVLRNDEYTNHDLINTARNNAGYAPLHLAAKLGNVAILEALIAKGANVNMGIQGLSEAHEIEKTAFDIACLHDQVDAAKCLLENHNANPNHRCATGENVPLYFAASSGKLKIVKYLFNHPKINNKNPKNQAPELLTIACYDNKTPNFPVVKYFTEELNVDPTVKIFSGGTPLRGAIHGENFELVRYLIEHGANVQELNNNDEEDAKYFESEVERIKKKNEVQEDQKSILIDILAYLKVCKIITDTSFPLNPTPNETPETIQEQLLQQQTDALNNFLEIIYAPIHEIGNNNLKADLLFQAAKKIESFEFSNQFESNIKIINSLLKQAANIPNTTVNQAVNFMLGERYLRQGKDIKALDHLLLAGEAGIPLVKRLLYGTSLNRDLNELPDPRGNLELIEKFKNRKKIPSSAGQQAEPAVKNSVLHHYEAKSPNELPNSNNDPDKKSIRAKSRKK